MKIKEITDAYLPVINPLIKASSGTSYRALFLEPNPQANLSIELLYRLREMYLLGILERSHLTCITYLARASRWLTATVVAMNGNSLLGFAGGLRGHLESAADAFDVLQYLPNTLVKSMKYAFLTFHHPDDLGQISVNFEKIENALIHYAYARRKPNLTDPPQHKKKNASQYNQQLEEFGAPRLNELYGKLCELVHPAAPSVNCFLDENSSSLIFNPNRDRELIDEMASEYEEAIQAMTQYTLNSALMCLSMLRRLDSSWAAPTDEQLKDVGNLLVKLNEFDNFVNSYKSGQADQMKIIREINL